MKRGWCPCAFWVGDRPLAGILACQQNSSAEYMALLGFKGGVMDGAPTGESIVLLRYFNTHVGNDSETWRTSLPDLNLNGHSLSKHLVGAQLCPQAGQDAFGQRLMIDFVVI